MDGRDDGVIAIDVYVYVLYGHLSACERALIDHLLNELSDVLFALTVPAIVLIGIERHHLVQVQRRKSLLQPGKFL